MNEDGLRVVELPNDPARLDELMLRIAAAVVAEFPLEQIRARSIQNLERWRTAGTWGSAYDEWLALMREAPDAELLAAMLGRDDNSNRLRSRRPLLACCSTARFGGFAKQWASRGAENRGRPRPAARHVARLIGCRRMRPAARLQRR